MAARQYNPPHPGEVLWGLDMEPAGITVTALAQHLGVDRKTVSRLVNGRTSITAEMAILLGKAFNTTPDVWLNMQHSYDLWHASQAMKQRLRSVKPFTVSAPIHPTHP